jgi:probable phosphoglycerate mutase
LLEQDFGRWEGLTFAEAAQRFSHDFAAWQADAALAGPTGGEALTQVAERVVNLYHDLSRQQSSETVLLVAHGGVLNALLCTLLQTPLRWLWAYRLEPGAICEILAYEEGAVLTRLSCI